MSWEDIDSFGNNCIHSAAASGNYTIFETFMMVGCEIDLKNTRGHDVSDLSTEKNISMLLKEH